MREIGAPTAEPDLREQPSAPGAPGAAGPAARSSDQTLTLLYIEDHPASVSVMEAILGLCPPWRLVHAGQVATGIEAAHTHHPDLILLDMHLPDGSGEQVLTALKADRDTHDIPIVVLTAGTSGKNAGSLLEAGADQFWTKPHDIDLMLEYSTKSPPAAHRVRISGRVARAIRRVGDGGLPAVTRPGTARGRRPGSR